MPESKEQRATRPPGTVTENASERGLPSRLRSVLSARLGDASAAVRSAAPDNLNPSQMLMNRLRPSRQLEKAADQELRPLGFGLYGAIALDFIARQPYPPRLADIARFLMQEPQSLTALVKRLERRGWVRRRPSQGDRRAVLLELTEAGRQLHQRLVRILEGLLQDGELDSPSEAASRQPSAFSRRSVRT